MAPREHVFVEVKGTFDAAAARALDAAFLGGVSDVTIDFSRASWIDPLALAMLADELAHGERTVKVLGLARHHERLLRYLGAPLADAPGDATGNGF